MRSGIASDEWGWREQVHEAAQPSRCSGFFLQAVFEIRHWRAMIVEQQSGVRAMTTESSFQDHYPDDWAHCYGCGRLNQHGLHIQSYWEGDQSVCTFQPKPYHVAIPGFVYGGLIASLIDCHATGTASATAYRAQGRPLGSEPPLRFVTASLQVDYLRPTPLGPPLRLQALPKEIKGRKVVVAVELFAEDQLCARGEVVCVQWPGSAKT
jgi:acyl-coenzyme A thioesterase PaaI-like protein